MSEQRSNFRLTTRWAIPVAFFLLIILGYFVQIKTFRGRKLALVSCQNDVLWPGKPLEGEKSCPLWPDSQTHVTFWNEEKFHQEKQVVFHLLAKVNWDLIMPAIIGIFKVDGALVSFDKKTHQIVNKRFTTFSKEYPFKLNNVTQISEEVPIISEPLDPRLYYRFELYDLNAIYIRGEFGVNVDMSSEWFKNKKFLVNALFTTTDMYPYKVARQFQLPSFTIGLLFFAYFVWRMITKGKFDLYYLFALIASASTLIYLWPGMVPGLTPTQNFIQFQLILSVAFDAVLLGKFTSKKISSFLFFIGICINLINIPVTMIAVIETKTDEFLRSGENHLPQASHYREYLETVAKIRMISHWIILSLGLLGVKKISRPLAQLIPGFVVATFWFRQAAKNDGKYMEQYVMPARAVIDFGVVPIALLLLHLAVLETEDSYLGLAVPEDHPKLMEIWPISKLKGILRIDEPVKTEKTSN